MNGSQEIQTWETSDRKDNSWFGQFLLTEVYFTHCWFLDTRWLLMYAPYWLRRWTSRPCRWWRGRLWGLFAFVQLTSGRRKCTQRKDVKIYIWFADHAFCWDTGTNERSWYSTYLSCIYQDQDIPGYQLPSWNSIPIIWSSIFFFTLHTG